MWYLCVLGSFAGCVPLDTALSGKVSEQSSDLSSLPASSQIPVKTCSRPGVLNQEICIEALLSLPDQDPAIMIPNFFSIQTLQGLLKDSSSSPPEATEVRVNITLKNSSNLNLNLMSGSDGAKNFFDIAGPGYVVFKNPQTVYTADFRMGTPIPLSPNQSTVQTLGHLQGGLRGTEIFYYLTREGNYKLRVSGQIMIMLPPQGQTPAFEGTIPILSNVIDLQTFF